MARQVRVVLVAGWVALALLLSAPRPVASACRMTSIEWYNPTGWEGCTVYGTGIASRYPGPGVARNDCLWPWHDCTTIRITSLDTGRSIVVTPSMFCDCYTRTADERLVDLDPDAVRMLGLDWSRGLYPVTVEPVDRDESPPSRSASLPDTAMR